MALKKGVEVREGLDPVSSLRESLNGRALAAIAFLVALVAGGCMPDDYKKCGCSVVRAARSCLYAHVPAFQSKVCKPDEIDGLLRVMSAKCPGGVGNLNEGIPFNCRTHLGDSRLPPVETTVRQMVIEVLNDECKTAGGGQSTRWWREGGPWCD
ncbi:MAG: hypothetical protein WC604_01740 [Candidatus Gracilibacteria bacterium]